VPGAQRQTGRSSFLACVNAGSRLRLPVRVMVSEIGYAPTDVVELGGSV
jgi:hypothetical protein